LFGRGLLQLNRSVALQRHRAADAQGGTFIDLKRSGIVDRDIVERWVAENIAVGIDGGRATDRQAAPDDRGVFEQRQLRVRGGLPDFDIAIVGDGGVCQRGA
jgi:hypothetical protein